ncbi:MAG: hypothetical protein AAGJ52_00810 [Pseudomonadota bacterium]
MTLKGFLRCAQTTLSLTPALRLQGEFLLANDSKETREASEALAKAFIRKADSNKRS